MEDIIRKSLKNATADFVEVTIQERISTSIKYMGEELENLSIHQGAGGSVRLSTREDGVLHLSTA